MAIGIALIAVGGAVMAIVMFRLWRSLPAALVLALAAACGLAIAAGGLLVQDAADAASWVVALVLLGVLGPLHARLICGPPGPHR